MITEVTLHSHYLPADAVTFIAAEALRHSALACVAVLLSFGGAVAYLRRRFGRGGVDIFALALVCVVVAIFAGACVYLLVTRPGYRVFHPGF